MFYQINLFMNIMNNSIKYLKTITRTVFTGISIIALFFAISCDTTNDDPEPELYDLTGVYTFKEATLQTKVTINIGILPITVPAGTNITDEMAGGLLAEAPCGDINNGAVELKESHELFFACIGEDVELKAGTWAINDDWTELDLNLSVSTGNLQLKLESFEVDEVNDVISGSIVSFPLTPDLMLGFLPATMTEGKSAAELEILKALFDAVTQVDVDIAFQKETE